MTFPLLFLGVQMNLLQVPMDEAFSFVDHVPLATASVAQVHAAILRGSNKDVVIKVSVVEYLCAYRDIRIPS